MGTEIIDMQNYGMSASLSSISSKVDSGAISVGASETQSKVDSGAVLTSGVSSKVDSNASLISKVDSKVDSSLVIVGSGLTAVDSRVSSGASLNVSTTNSATGSVATTVQSKIESGVILTDSKVDSSAIVSVASKIATTTISLNQIAGTYDLFTGTSQPVILDGLSIKMPTGAAGGSLTSISVQTDDVTPGVIISSALGAVANLTSEAELSWEGELRIDVGTKIQLTIAGGAHGSAYVANVVASYRPIVSGGSL